MSLDDLQDAAEYAHASTIDLDTLAEVIRDVLTAGSDAGLAEIVQTQIARSAAARDEPGTSVAPERACDQQPTVVEAPEAT